GGEDGDPPPAQALWRTPAPGRGPNRCDFGRDRSGAAPFAERLGRKVNRRFPVTSARRFGGNRVMTAMANAQKCSQCGAELDPGLPRGLCGQCLISLGLASGLSETIPETGFSAPRAELSDALTSPTLGRIGDYELIDEIARGGM